MTYHVPQLATPRMAKKYYIGLSVTYHDPALAIVDDRGEVLFAEATERYLQYKRALNAEPDNLYFLPALVETYCPAPDEFVVAFNWCKRRPLYEDLMARLGFLSAPGLLKEGIKKLRSPLENYKLHHMMACQRGSIARAGVSLARRLRERFPCCRISFVHFDHHRTHAALACYGCPFDEAVCAVIDSYGQHGSMAFYHYRDGQLHLHHESCGLGSLGLYYMKLTEWCGFDWTQGEEWKVMGLAAYGRMDEEIYALLRDTVTVDGLDVRHDSPTLFESLAKLERRRRHKEEPAETVANLAYTGQYVFAEAMETILRNLYQAGLSENLVLTGGCALNSSFNGHVLERTPFKQLCVPPAPADDGTALGAAWLAFRKEVFDPLSLRERERDRVRGLPHPNLLPEGEGAKCASSGFLSPYLGSTISTKTLTNLIQYAKGLDMRHLPDTMCDETAKLLAAGKLVGWVQGRAEFGPRALGNRSILADPRERAMKDRINALVKFREEYRPFAPSILHEFGPDYFENYQESPYMERTLRFRNEAAEKVPVVVHVDQTGRLQTVKREWNPRFYELIEAFYRLTGVPVVLNTSFNVMGKPIIHSVEDAIGVFMTTGLDALVIEDWLFLKPEV
jgi:carbamoyltransferase